jgi:hypothetical protein
LRRRSLEKEIVWEYMSPLSWAPTYMATSQMNFFALTAIVHVRYEISKGRRQLALYDRRIFAAGC